MRRPSYNTDGYLTAITAGVAGDSTVRRKLIVQYVSGTHRIHTVTLEPTNATPRVWTYSYTGSSPYEMQLSSVTLPDGSHWHFNLGAFDGAGSIGVLEDGTCDKVAVPADAGQSAVGSMTHPSGLQGSFTVVMKKHGRSYSPHGCASPSGPKAPGSYALTPDLWYAFTITQKTFTGAGLPTAGETWKFSYSEPNASWVDACSSGCPGTIWTQVLRPDGSSKRFIFSNRWGYTESQLLNTKTYSGNGTGLLREVVNTYAKPTGHAWPSSIGINPQSRINKYQTTQRSPLSKRVIKQSGDTYTWQAEAFNAYAQVTRTRRSNSIAGQHAVEESTTYRNDTTHWVLGLPLVHTNLTTGKVVNQNTYNATTDLLTARDRFGEPMMSYVWNSDGQLASFTDGDSHTTALSNYKRGIPQTIGYPDGTSESLNVDDFGQITSITNQAGHTTRYTYNASGRLTKIAYPTDGKTRYPKTFQYQYVTSAERGLAADHWKRIASQGSARHVTYYDAFLHPVLTDTYIAGDSSSHISAKKAYDWKGLTTFASWPMAGRPALSAITAGTTTTYDVLGRVIQVSQPSQLAPGSSVAPVTLTTTTTYLSGNRKRVTGPAGHVTTTSYQVFDQPSYGAVIKVQAPAGVVQSISRNVYGQPTVITQSGPDRAGGTVSSTKKYVYDAYQRLCRIAEPETGSAVFTYDAANNIIGSAEGLTITGKGCGTLPASHITRTYDAMNRLLTVSYPDGNGDTTTTYNATGQVHSATATTFNGAVAWVYAYNSQGRLITETLSVPGHSWAVHHGYDNYGHPNRITYPDGKRIAYAPDALGRSAKAGPYATQASYYPDGTLKYFVYMGGKEDYLASRQTRHLMNLTVGNGSSSVYSEDFSYDKAGNITAMDDLTPSGVRNETLTYDALNRLTKALAPNLWGTATYTYDALNNIRKLVSGGVTHTYHYNTANNRLISMTDGSTTHTLAYDPRGDVIKEGNQVRDFDDAHRLLKVSGVASYVYDAAGRRVEKIETNGDKTYDLYSRAGQLLYQWNATTGANTDYVYLGKHLVAELKRPKGAPVVNAPGVTVSQTPNNGSYTLSWAGTSGVTYTLQERVNNGSWHTVYRGTATHKAESGKAGGTYRYRLQACDGDCSDWSASTSVGVTPAKPALTIPTGYRHDAYTIKWTKPTGTTSFTVQEQFDGGSWKTVYSGMATSTHRPGTTNGHYVYRVRASNAHGSRGWVTSGTVTVLYPPAKAPSLSVPGIDRTHSYTVSWGSVSGATSYTLEERKNNGSWGTTYKGSHRSKAESGKTNGATYGYRVHACNAAGCSSWSTTHTITIKVPPSKPTGVYTDDELSSSIHESLIVVWKAVSGATKYDIKDENTGIIVWSGTGTSHMVASGSPHPNVAAVHPMLMPPIVKHSYSVRACNSWACSAWVAAPRRTVTPAPGAAPSLSVPSSNSSGSYTVGWGSVFNATSYTLQQQTNGGSWHTAYSGGGTHKGFSGKRTGRYGYRVKACNATGCSAWSGVKTVHVTVLGRVSGLTASVTYTEMTGNSVAAQPTASAGLHPDQMKPPPAGSYKWILHAHWNAVSGAMTYNVRYDRASDGVTMTTYTTREPALGQEERPIVMGPDIRVYARACNSDGCSAWVGPVTPTVYQ